jgi:hypothetical protein
MHARSGRVASGAVRQALCLRAWARRHASLLSSNAGASDSIGLISVGPA